MRYALPAFLAVAGLVPSLPQGKADAAPAPRGAAKTATVEKIRVSEEGGKSTIVITTSGKPTFTTWKLDRPARVVVDVTNARLGDVDVPFDANTFALGAVAASVSEDEGGSRTRVFLTLRRPGDYTVRATGHEIIVVVASHEVPPAPVAEAALKSAEQAEAARRAAEGARLAAEGEARRLADEKARADAARLRAEEAQANADDERQRAVAALATAVEAQRRAEARSAGASSAEAAEARKELQAARSEVEKARASAAAATAAAADVAARVAKDKRELDAARTVLDKRAADLAAAEADLRKDRRETEQARRRAEEAEKQAEVARLREEERGNAVRDAAAQVAAHRRALEAKLSDQERQKLKIEEMQRVVAEREAALKKAAAELAARERSLAEAASRRADLEKTGRSRDEVARAATEVDENQAARRAAMAQAERSKMALAEAEKGGKAEGARTAALAAERKDEERKLKLATAQREAQERRLLEAEAARRNEEEKLARAVTARNTVEAQRSEALVEHGEAEAALREIEAKRDRAVSEQSAVLLAKRDTYEKRLASIEAARRAEEEKLARVKAERERHEQRLVAAEATRRAEEQELARLKAERAAIATGVPARSPSPPATLSPVLAAPAAAPPPPSIPVQAALAPAPATVVAARPSSIKLTAPSRVQRIDFIDEPSRSSVVIELDSPAAFAVERMAGRRLTLRLLHADLPRGLERRLDATEYLGPVRLISSFRDPAEARTVRVVVDLAEDVPQSVRQSGTRLYWDFQKPRSESVAGTRPPRARVMSLPGRKVAGFRADGLTAGAAASAAASVWAQAATSATSPNGVRAGQQKKRYTGRRIDLDFKGADIHNILRLLADVGQVNIVTADEVKGEVTIKMKNVPWDQALDVVLRAKLLGQVREGNLIRVAPLSVLEKELEQEISRQKQLTDVLPTETRLIGVSYAEASQLEPRARDLLSPRGKISVDARTNHLIVSDVSKSLSLIEELVRNLDTQTSQVVIEARIVEARSTFTRQIGIQWGGDGFADTAHGNATGLVFPQNVGVAGGADDPGAPLNGLVPRPRNGSGTASPNFAVNMPAPAGLGAGGAIGLTLGSVAGAFNLNLRLSALESTGQIRILSSPRISTMDNVEATISQGVSIPISVVSAQGVQTQFVDASLNLTVKPHVTNEGTVIMKVSVTRNEPDFGNTGARGDPSILKKEARTEMLVRDGDTAVIGGIYTRNSGLSVAKVPFFAELPILGFFFRNKRENDDRTEFLVFITPRIANRARAVGQ